MTTPTLTKPVTQASAPSKATAKGATIVKPPAGEISVSGQATVKKVTLLKGTDGSENLLDGSNAPLHETDASLSQTPVLGFLDENTPVLPQGKYRLRPLTKGEMDELETCETVVREGMPKFLAVGEALLRIREKKLWRMYCCSWGEYLEKRVGISGAYASMQTNAAKAMQNLLTNGEQTERPTTERQLRPLLGLSSENQVAAWNLAVTKAAGKKVTGKVVEDAVAQVLGDDALPQGWLDRMRHKLVTAGYETDFVQPVDLGEKTWVDLFNETTQTYVKLIDAPTLGNLGTCYAMRDKGLKYQVIVDGQSVPKRKLEAAKDGTLSRLLDPVLSVFIHSLGAFVEHDGRLYEAGDLNDEFKLALKPSEGVEANDLRVALEPSVQVGAETTAD